MFSANSNNKHGQEALGNSPEITYVESSGIPNSIKTKIETVVNTTENKLRFFFPDIPTKIIYKIEFIDRDLTIVGLVIGSLKGCLDKIDCLNMRALE